jgi:hypothetical protein
MKMFVKSVKNRNVLDTQEDGMLTQKKVIDWEVEKYPSLGRSDYNLEDGGSVFLWKCGIHLKYYTL